MYSKCKLTHHLQLMASQIGVNVSYAGRCQHNQLINAVVVDQHDFLVMQFAKHLLSWQFAFKLTWGDYNRHVFFVVPALSTKFTKVTFIEWIEYNSSIMYIYKEMYEKYIWFIITMAEIWHYYTVQFTYHCLSKQILYSIHQTVKCKVGRQVLELSLGSTLTVPSTTFSYQRKQQHTPH